MALMALVSVVSVECFAQGAPEATRAPAGKRVGQIRQDEREKYRTRYEAKNSTTFSFGPSTAMNLNNSNMIYSAGLGYEWEAGAQGAIYAALDGHFGSSTTFVDGMVGGKYFFTAEDVSPFVRGGFGMGSASGSDLESKAGFAGQIGAGVTFFRTSSVHLEVGATYTALFVSNEKGTPSVGSLQLSILF